MQKHTHNTHKSTQVTMSTFIPLTNSNISMIIQLFCSMYDRKNISKKRTARFMEAIKETYAKHHGMWVHLCGYPRESPDGTTKRCTREVEGPGQRCFRHGTGRCHAYTKMGMPCCNVHREDSKYCWRHGVNSGEPPTVSSRKTSKKYKVDSKDLPGEKVPKEYTEVEVHGKHKKSSRKSSEISREISNRKSSKKSSMKSSDTPSEKPSKKPSRNASEKTDKKHRGRSNDKPSEKPSKTSSKKPSGNPSGNPSMKTDKKHSGRSEDEEVHTKKSSKESSRKHRVRSQEEEVPTGHQQEIPKKKASKSSHAGDQSRSKYKTTVTDADEEYMVDDIADDKPPLVQPRSLDEILRDNRELMNTHWFELTGDYPVA